jgi:DeoR family fructose operon transcriptional repressor
MMAHADEVIVLADSTKFGRRLFAQVSELGRADRLVTDAAPEVDLHDALQAADVKVLTPQNAPPEHSA